MSGTKDLLNGIGGASAEDPASTQFETPDWMNNGQDICYIGKIP